MTIQQLTSQLQQMEEQMNSINSSGDKVQRNREALLSELQPKVKTSLTSEAGQNYDTIPMPTFASEQDFDVRWDRQGDGVPKVPNRRRRTREGPELACVHAPFTWRWHTQEWKGE